MASRSGLGATRSTAGRLLVSLALFGAVVAGCTPAEERLPVDPVELVDSTGPLLLVGLDGATFGIVEPLVEAGLLPNLGALMERGSQAPLGTLEPTVSPAIWTTIATGKLPEEHGILGFEGVPGQSMSTLPTTGMRRVRAFWNVLTEFGRSVGVVGWWVTWPAEAVNGYVVSDRLAYTRMEATIAAEERSPEDVYPRDLADEVRGLVLGPGEITADEVRRFMPLSDEEVERLIVGAEYVHGHFLPEFKYVHQSDRSTADIAVRLLETRPTDVTAVAFYGVDTVSHLTWHFMEPERFERFALDAGAIEKYGELIESYYVYVDELLGELLAAAPEDSTVIVFSDHGFAATGELPWSGGHGKVTPGAPIAPDGILIMAGPPIRQGARLERTTVLDLLPTLLYLQGFPVGRDMPGRVLSEAIDPELLARAPVRSVATYETSPLHDPDAEIRGDEAADQELLEKLRRLGYVE